MDFRVNWCGGNRRDGGYVGQIRLGQPSDLVEWPGDFHAGVNLEWHEAVKQGLRELQITKLRRLKIGKEKSRSFQRRMWHVRRHRETGEEHCQPVL